MYQLTLYSLKFSCVGEQQAEEGKEMAVSSQSMPVALSPKSPASPFSPNTEVCTCVKSGHGGRAQTPAHGASMCWSRRLAVTLKENDRYKT